MEKHLEIDQIFGCHVDDLITNTSRTIAIVKTEKINKETLEKYFEHRPLDAYKPKDLVIELAKLCQYIKDQYKYSFDIELVEKAIISLDKCGILDSLGGIVYILKAEAYPIIISSGDNSLWIAPKVEE